jgi:chromosome segregation ATPase
MQSRVLSAVPSGVSQQMKALVGQLATFNRNFRSNTEAINTTLSRAKEVYQSQADVIEEYKAIDLEGIANGVSSIMRRLRSSTESLDNFTQYLNTVHEYYDEMQVFVEKLDRETERIGILQDIQKFFQSHKAVIAEETSEAHKNIQQSIKAVQDSTEQQVNKTYVALTEQSQKLKSAVDENNEQFRMLCQDMRNKFKEQMDAIPTVAQNLKKLEEIPHKLEAAVTKITQSHERLASDFLAASQRIAANAAGKGAEQSSNGVAQFGRNATPIEIPTSLKWTVIVGVVLISLATIGNTVYNIWKGETTLVNVEQVQQTNDSIVPAVPTQVKDTVRVLKP